MNEKPLERLNYYNGQRLQAADFRLEQDYHIRVRHWLNRSLYSAGIASGLNVYAVVGKPKVRVTAGLAIDPAGREIILLEDEVVDVVGEHHDASDKGSGPYLSIRYQEDVVGREDHVCSRAGNLANRPAWGGPARILSSAVLELTMDLPSPESGRIPLACLTLAPGCDSVQSVETFVRRYVGEGSASKVRQYALEGERNIDHDNDGKIVFHVRGRQPSAVTLYLKAEEFPTLFYTELGSHNHSSSAATVKPETSAPILHPETTNPDKYKHTHALNTLTTTTDGSAHDHTELNVTFEGAHGYDVDRRMGVSSAIQVGVPVYGNILPVLSTPARWSDDNNHPPFTANISGATGHTHGVAGTLELVAVSDDHTHQVPLLSIVASGVDDIDALDGHALTFVNDMHVYVDGSDVTPAVLEQLKNADPDWRDFSADLLGNGGGGHPFATKGSGPIKLDFIAGLIFGEGEHTIELKLPGALKANGGRNGGRIHFNLYVE